VDGDVFHFSSRFGLDSIFRKCRFDVVLLLCAMG
jgi:hypothetical protein